MKIINYLSRVIKFSKDHRLFVLLYLVIFFGIWVGVNIYIESEVDDSYEQLNNQLESQYGSENGFCYRNESSYSIVSYKKTDIPEIGREDSSIYMQKYGRAHFYYEATNQPWNIRQIIFENGRLYRYVINPKSVALNGTTYPEYQFRQLYNNIIDNYNVSFLTYSKELDDIKNDYHHLEYTHRDSDYSETIWFTDELDKLFFTRHLVGYYSIEIDNYKVRRILWIRIVSLIFLETLIFVLFWYFKYKLKNKKISTLKNVKIPFIEESTPSNQSITDTEYEVLLHKINPINFMDPYDAEKVRIANDLYSALLKSRDNETIIRMIEEKAKTILKIK